MATLDFERLYLGSYDFDDDGGEDEVLVRGNVVRHADVDIRSDVVLYGRISRLDLDEMQFANFDFSIVGS